MNDKVKHILNDLYKIDESFRVHEQDLIKLITFDKKFIEFSGKLIITRSKVF